MFTCALEYRPLTSTLMLGRTWQLRRFFQRFHIWRFCISISISRLVKTLFFKSKEISLINLLFNAPLTVCIECQNISMGPRIAKSILFVAHEVVLFILFLNFFFLSFYFKLVSRFSIFELRLFKDYFYFHFVFVPGIF